MPASLKYSMVVGYDAMTNVQTVNAAFAHDLNDGRTIIIHVNQALREWNIPCYVPIRLE